MRTCGKTRDNLLNKLRPYCWLPAPAKCTCSAPLHRSRPRIPAIWTSPFPAYLRRAILKALGDAMDALGMSIDLVDLDEDNPFTRYLKQGGVLARIA